MRNVTTEEIKALLGVEVERVITAGKYGDTAIWSGGFYTGDPCYFLPNALYDSFRKAAVEQRPDAYGRGSEVWAEIEWLGVRCYFRTQGDGRGDFGHSVDSGWVVVIPEGALPGVMVGRGEVRSDEMKGEAVAMGEGEARLAKLAVGSAKYEGEHAKWMLAGDAFQTKWGRSWMDVVNADVIGGVA